MKGRGPRPKIDPGVELRTDLRSAFRWSGDRTDDGYYADPTGWWADGSILRRLGPALAGLLPDAEPTVVMGTASRGSLLAALVATHLGLGMIEVRKNPTRGADSERWLAAHTPPDYRDRTLRLGARRDHLPAGERVLFVDDWIDTGGQARGAHTLVASAQASWCGAVVIVDALQDARIRRDLAVRSLLSIREL